MSVAKLSWLGLIVFAAALAAQTTRIPVVLLNGYQATCSGNSNSSATFGSMESQLVADGWQVAFFDSCSVLSRTSARPTIEEIAQSFGAFLDRLGAPEVDVVAHSMGGLIVRAWLAGKQPGGGFSPPPVIRIRKAVFLAAPHAGVLAIAGILGANTADSQTVEMFAGSSFLWDLATWNQRADDLRGIDALSIVGNRGGSSGSPHSHDGVVVMTSASLAATFGASRTRVLPYCHADNLPAQLCSGPGIAVVTDRNHPTYLIVRSYLLGATDWQTIGDDASQDAVLSRYGGLLVDYRDKSGNPVSNPGPAVLAREGRATPAVPQTGDLPWNSQGVFFADYVPSGQYQVAVGGGSYPLSMVGGGHIALSLKQGPRIDLVAPAAGKVPALSLAPGMLIAIYGGRLENASVTIDGSSSPVLFNSAEQINTLVPEDSHGLVTLSVANAAGRDTLKILVERAVPAIFTADGSGSGAALALHNSDQSPVWPSHPVHPGETVSIFLTGLGNPIQSPVLQADGVAVELVSVSPLAGSPGVYRLDFVAAAPKAASHTTQLQAVAGAHRSNVVTLDVEP